MATAIAHRGPDDMGIWQEAGWPIGFAHRRLAIVDLSPAGHQPMHSADGRVTIAYNGEIYNHLDLRRELEYSAHRAWRGQSDTETLVEAIATWGLEATLQRAVGMFALAIWDRTDRTLSLARDRFGEKPLYYGWVGRDFVFASELKAIRSIPEFVNEVNREALGLFAARGYIPAPYSIYNGIFKLEPGVILTATPDSVRAPRYSPPRANEKNGGISLSSYWSYGRVVLDGLANPIRSHTEALDTLEDALTRSIAGQAVADVPVGAFLSGGVDSSTVVALYQKTFPGQVKTFTIGFEEPGFDEAMHARAVAAHFGTEHFEHYVGVAEAQAVIPLLPTMYDEPFADSSQIPTHLVSRLARQHVTVALSGDAGDELFGGYNRYIAAPRLWRSIRYLPRPIRRAIGGAFQKVPPAMWNDIVSLGADGRRSAHLGHRLQKLMRAVSDARGIDDVMDGLLDEWSAFGSPVLGVSTSPPSAAFGLALPGASEEQRMMYLDAVSYLPDDILCKVDRAAMAVSLETRVPFLDHRLVEVAARIPLSMKIQGATGKSVLRSVLYRHAPPALFNRPKAGFAVPVGEWIRGPLRDWAESLFDQRLLDEKGFFDSAKVQRRWQDHLSGRQDSTQALWSILMFQAWLRNQSADQARG